MDNYVADGYRLEKGDFTEDEKKVSLRSEKIYNDNKIELNEFQTSILNSIKSDGIAVCHVNDFNDKNLKEKFTQLKEYYQKFKTHPKVQQRINDYQLGKSLGGNKEFEVNSSHYLGRNLDLGDGVVEFFLSDIFLNLSSAYLAKCPKAFQFNSWIHVSHPSKISRVSSMNWHRDPEAIRIFKIFLIVEDIGPTNGPFQYIKGSHVDGKYSSLQKYRISGRYPDNSLIESKVDKEDIVSLTGPSGTIAFVDNFGFHRGGYVESGLRLLAQGVFLKPEVIRLPIWKSQRINLNLQNQTYSKLSPMAQYAVNNEF
jgi:hypothetical protein